MALTFLLVDDSGVTRAMTSRALKMSGLPIREVLEASNGLEGLALLEKHSVDIALVDINMPIMNGEEMIRRLRQNEKTAHLPVLVLSTEGSQVRIGRLVEEGAVFVHKPFRPETLREGILEVLGETDECDQPGPVERIGVDL